jgi:heme/copper-type cytochrome/quinol oxidase subunit 2
LGLSDDSLFKQNLFKKTQLVGEKKQKPTLPIIDFNQTRLWETSDTDSFINFFQNEVLGKSTTTNKIQHPDLDDETRIVKRNSGKNTPIRVLKCPNSDFFFKPDLVDSNNVELFRFRFNEQKSTIASKPVRPTVYLTFKQKRYNQRTNIGKKTQMFYDRDLKKNQSYSGNPFLKNMSIIEENFGNPTRQYRMVKKAKSRLDTTRVATWNRLLRSRRVLVLPAHINITVITNSFDIVHSWHIPGLGLKMDCLPGRATHHTLYIDNVGLYYGQCAEICGRYHHHMPIRVCALPFEHFLVW